MADDLAAWWELLNEADRQLFLDYGHYQLPDIAVRLLTDAGMAMRVVEVDGETVSWMTGAMVEFLDNIANDPNRG